MRDKTSDFRKKHPRLFIVVSALFLLLLSAGLFLCPALVIAIFRYIVAVLCAVAGAYLLVSVVSAKHR